MITFGSSTSHVNVDQPTSLSTFLQMFQMRKLTEIQASNPCLADMSVAAVTMIGAAIWIKVCIQLAKLMRVRNKDTRKLIHITSAPIFLLCWPLFSDRWSARLFATIVPVTQITRLLFASRERSTDELSHSISRGGSKEEALGGPLFYVIVLAAITLGLWRTSTAGIVAISQLAGGDGLAELVGRRFGGLTWKFSNKKTLAGSLGFVLGGAMMSMMLLSYFSWWKFINFQPIHYLLEIITISIICAAAELLPFVDDNFIVPLVGFLTAQIILPTPKVTESLF